MQSVKMAGQKKGKNKTNRKARERFEKRAEEMSFRIGYTNAEVG